MLDKQSNINDRASVMNGSKLSGCPSWLDGIKMARKPEGDDTADLGVAFYPFRRLIGTEGEAHAPLTSLPGGHLFDVSVISPKRN